MTINNKIKVDIDDNYLYLIINNITYKYDIISISEILNNAKIEERKKFTISPSGYGIHWASLDEDLSVPALLKLKNTQTL
jgi:hypothetical protein